MWVVIDNLISRPVYYSIYYLTQAIVFPLLIWFIVFRAQMFVNLVIGGGLAIAIGGGFIFLVMPFVGFVSLLLIPVAFFIAVVYPLLLVFGD